VIFVKSDARTSEIRDSGGGGNPGAADMIRFDEFGNPWQVDAGKVRDVGAMKYANRFGGRFSCGTWRHEVKGSRIGKGMAFFGCENGSTGF